jgi:hypothetical protein
MDAEYRKVGAFLVWVPTFTRQAELNSDAFVQYLKKHIFGE